MKIAISNIAWHIHEEESIAKIMEEFGVQGVEIAPTKIWQSPLSASDSEIASYRDFWNSRGIQIVAMQALLFGRSELTIFQNAQKRQETCEYLSGIITLASKLGVNNLVFGSPKNRLIGDKNIQESHEVATSFFHTLGEVAAQKGVVLCIEPNPSDYGCDFITTSKQGLDLVNEVNSEGFGLHLDAAGMTLANETVQPAIQSAFKRLCHFHISEPYLAPIGSGKVDHHIFSKTLSELNYQGWTSIEMKAQHPDSNVLNVTNAFETAMKYYA
jgi:D-psicose/D-tagatose/L-ribulose 3-epimerase